MGVGGKQSVQGWSVVYITSAWKWRLVEPDVTDTSFDRQTDVGQWSCVAVKVSRGG